MADTQIGIVYNTSMNRPDAALALAAMYPMEGRRESHMGAVCVVGGGFQTAVFCDIVGKLYTFGARNGNQALAVGLATDTPGVDAPMVKAAVAGKYERTLTRVADTSEPTALLRNGVIFNAMSTVILSGPATYLAKSLTLAGVKDLYKARVKSLIIVDAGATYNDAAALRRVIAEWPTPLVFCSKETGDAFQFPGATLESRFAWVPAHPVVDAYKAYKPMPYDAPLYDLLATYYTVNPTSEFFRLSGAGTIAVADDGAMKFAPGNGNVKSLQFDPAKKAELEAALISAATAKPVLPAPPGRGGRGVIGASGGRGVIVPAIIPGDSIRPAAK